MPRRPAVLLTSPRSTSASPLACPELRRVHSPYTSFVYKNEAHPLSPQPLPHSYTKTPGCHHQRFPISPLVHPQAKQDCHAPVAQGGVRAALRFFPRRFASLPPRTLPPPRTALAEDGGMLPPALTTEIAHQPARHSTPSHPRGRRSPQRQPPILASPRRRGPVGCPPTNLASTFQPLSSALPRLRHLHRGRQPRRPRLIPAPILRLLRRSFPHLQPGHPPVALLRHPLARRRPQCPAGRLRPLAGSALHPSAAHRRLLSRPSAAAQLSHQFEFLRQPDHAGHSRPAPVSRHLSPGIRPRHPLPCRALGTDLDRLVGRGVSCHAPDFSHRPLRTSRCAVTSSAPIAPPPESCRRSNDYHSAGCLRAGGAARLPLRRAFAQWRSPAISDRSHHCRRSRALVSRAPLSQSEVCTVRLRSQSSDGLRRIHLGSRRNLGKRLREEEIPFVLATLRAYPRQQILISAANFWHQLTAFDFAVDANDWMLKEFATVLPRQHARLLRSRQAQEDLPFEFFLSVQNWTVIASLAVIAGFAVRLCWHRPSRTVLLGGLGLVIVSAVIANAFVTGALSTVEDRYQSRVVWLIPLLAIVLLLDWSSQWKQVR